jgi:hypothetical protein
MRVFGGLGLALLLVCGCGDLGSRAEAGLAPEARLASQVCDEMCGWPDECFVQLGVPLQGSECVQTCEAQVEIVGIACVSAISSTIACLGTCDVESLSQDELIACQDEALAIESACE